MTEKSLTILVAGSRGFTNYDRLSTDLNYFKPTTIISGMAKGADRLAYNYGIAENIKVVECPANWDEYGKRAGYIRNTEMLLMKPDVVLYYWDGISKGTKHCILEAIKLNLSIRVVLFSNQEKSHLPQHTFRLNEEEVKFLLCSTGRVEEIQWFVTQKLVLKK
jgi:hypothetical protein